MVCGGVWSRVACPASFAGYVGVPCVTGQVWYVLQPSVHLLVQGYKGRKAPEAPQGVVNF